MTKFNFNVGKKSGEARRQPVSSSVESVDGLPYVKELNPVQNAALRQALDEKLPELLLKASRKAALVTIGEVRRRVERSVKRGQFVCTPEELLNSLDEMEIVAKGVKPKKVK